MARPLRVQYPGAVYHTMNRGASAQTIFRSPGNYRAFLDLLGEAVELWAIKIHAFSLMPNHYHLLVETPLANLSRAMRHIDGVYTQRFNRFHKRDGPLFRGRYKAILVEEDAYLVELARYIHLNPVIGKIVKGPQDHQWSSHAYYLGKGGLPWLETDRILSYFGKRRNRARRKLHEFILKGVPDTLRAKLEVQRWPSVYSSENFENWVEWNFVKDLSDREVQYIPENRHKITEKQLQKIICSVLEIEWRDLCEAKGRAAKQKRGLALRCYRQVLKYDYRRLSEIFGGIHSTNISRAMKREAKTMAHDWEILTWEIQNAKRKT